MASGFVQPTGTRVQNEWLYETTRCFDCGVDTEIEGYVNRVPGVCYLTDKGWIDGFICGPCSDTFDSAGDNGDDPWDALDAYLPNRIVAVDEVDTKATDFRRWFSEQKTLENSISSFFYGPNLREITNA